MEKKLSVVGIDIAKQVFHLVGMDEHGTILVRKRLYRAQVMALSDAHRPRRILPLPPRLSCVTILVRINGSLASRAVEL